MPSQPGSRKPVGARLFRTLLRLYPAGFRDDYERELTLVFADRYRDARGPRACARIWIEALFGVLVDASRERARTLGQDIAYAVRVLRANAFATTIIVVTLGLGIGANTAIFSLVNAVALRTLPVEHADELFTLNGGGYAGRGSERARLSGPMFERLREAAPDGVVLAAMSRGVARVHTRAGAEAQTLPASLQLVSPEYFRVLGTAMTAGRPLPAETSDPAGPVAVISHGYWQRRFGGAPDVVGRPVTLNGAAFTVIGVAARGFTGAWLELPVDIWVPLSAQSALRYSQDFSADNADLNRPWLPQPTIWWLHVVTRLPRDRAPMAAAAFNAAAPELASRGTPVVLEPFASGFSKLRQQFSLPLMALSVMAALVLLVACANVANLLLARAAARQREMGLRMALGARRGRLVQQLLAESLLTVVMAGAAAIAVAGWTSDVLVRMATAAADAPPPFAATVDLRVLAFTAAVALASVLFFGLVPAWRATRINVVEALKAGARGTAGGHARPARALVVLQVALSLVLVTGTGLLARSFGNLLAIDPGFARDFLLSATIDPRLSRDVTPADWPQLNDRILAAVRAVPGVQSAALAQCGIQSNCRARETGWVIEGYQPRRGEEVGFLLNAVSPDYFATVGMRLIEGRVLGERDVASGAPVAVVTRSVGETYFGGRPLGRRFGSGTANVEVVGVVEDARVLTLADQPPPMVYFPLSQRPVAARALDIRTEVDPGALINDVRRALRAAAGDVPVESIVTMDERLRRGLSQPRTVMALTSAFGLLALGLAGFGLFGVLSYAVARRTAEFGVRMALGASSRDVLWSVVKEGLTLVLYGMLLGLPAVLLAGNVASALLFGVSASDPATMTTAAALLAGVGAASGLVPALRAARVDPMAALREE